jgi:hypothetical protein
MKLAEQINRRFLFRFIVARHSFAEIREKNCIPDMTDLQCFIELLKSQLSDEATIVLDKAKIRHERYEKLLYTVFKKSRRSREKKTLAQLEANHIKAIVAFEVKNNEGDPSWSFTRRGMSSLVDDFFLWNEYLNDFGSTRLPEWSSMYARWTIPPEKVKDIEAITDKKARADKYVEVVGPILQPISAFFVALCHTLQEGENELTASDAYWLGIVDEVVGEPLPTERWMAEYREDAKPQEHAQD